ncbi:MAG: hypothetical protein RL518_710 [Pseudomonadota bacterium]
MSLYDSGHSHYDQTIVSGEELMKLSVHIAAILITATCALSASAQTQPTQPAQTHQRADTISGAVGLNELKIEMAESRLKLAANPKVISDLASALEEYLTTTCMAKLPQTLSYAGNPTDPTCIARMQRLLEINPGNPVAICVQHGISAKPCIDAYQDQKIWVVYPSSKDDVDPALKVGLSATTLERITKVEASLKDVNSKYQAAMTPDEKRALLNDAATLYDQILNMACKVSTVGLAPQKGEQSSVEPPEIVQTRAKLLQIPSGIRSDYQREMAGKAQKELDDPKTTPERAAQLKQLIAVIRNPNEFSPQQAANLKRTRYILAKCAEVIDMAERIVPDLPGVTCYRQGWYTPQCTYALKKWRMQKQQETVQGKGTAAPSSKKPSIISTF